LLKDQRTTVVGSVLATLTCSQEREIRGKKVPDHAKVYRPVRAVDDAIWEWLPPGSTEMRAPQAPLTLTASASRSSSLWRALAASALLAAQLRRLPTRVGRRKPSRDRRRPPGRPVWLPLLLRYKSVERRVALPLWRMLLVLLRRESADARGARGGSPAWPVLDMGGKPPKPVLDMGGRPP
jgi:hypothetical protein